MPPHLAAAIKAAVQSVPRRVPRSKVARLCGISRQYLHDLCEGRRVPSVKTIRGLAQWLPLDDEVVAELVALAPHPEVHVVSERNRVDLNP